MRWKGGEQLLTRVIVSPALRTEQTLRCSVKLYHVAASCFGVEIIYVLRNNRVDQPAFFQRCQCQVRIVGNCTGKSVVEDLLYEFPRLLRIGGEVTDIEKNRVELAP